MSTSEPPAPFADADPHGTALIARLLREHLAAPSTPPGALAPHGAVPTVPGADAVPVLPAPWRPPSGIPVRIPHEGSGLDPAGGYPRAADTAHPAVHPDLVPGGAGRAPAEVPATNGLERPPAGGHDPSAGDTHEFGEPRCSAPTFGHRSPGDAASGPASPQRPAGAPAWLPAEEASPADFYFLTPSAKPDPDPLSGHFLPKGSAGALGAAFDVERIRRDFPALHQSVNGRPLVWLDNAATTHKPKAVIDATSRFYGRDNSNIHRAAHTLAARSTELFEQGRTRVRDFLGASSEKEIVFVRGTTEAINLVAQSWGRAHVGPGDEILVTRIEHHANIVPWQLLARQVGATLKAAPVDDRGQLRLDAFAALLGPRTRIVSVTHVSNALGTINPVEEIIRLAHARGIPVLVDGAQSTPHIPINVQAMDADFFVFSGHKIFGPTGIGALYGKAALLEEMPPWQGGGHMIRDVTFERTEFQSAPEKFEAGTPDIAGVVGLGAAVEYLMGIGLPAIAAYEHSLLEYATEALSTVRGLRLIGTAAHKASVLSFVIPGVPNDRIARHLDDHGIAVRAGHHCAQPALRHFGLETTVRPSLAFYNTPSEVDTLVSALGSLPRR